MGGKITNWITYGYNGRKRFRICLEFSNYLFKFIERNELVRKILQQRVENR